MSAATRLRSRGAEAVLAARARLRGGPLPAPDAAPAPSGWVVPLAALRVRPDTVPDDVTWSINPDGAPGRALVQGLSTVGFPLQLDRPVVFTARVRLLPHDWLNGRSWVTATISSTDGDGVERSVWSATVAAANSRGLAEGAQVTCPIPPGTCMLNLSVSRPPATDGRAVGRAAWMSPTLIDPSEPAGSASTADADMLTLPHRATHPLISVLTPVHDPPLSMLREAIRSVQEQSFTNWELCLVDDGSRRPEIIAALREYADQDDRIMLIRHDEARGISAATNAALGVATGEFVALLDHDDTLHRDALRRVAETVAVDPDLDMIYSDESVVSETGRTLSRSLKPAWSPETMCSLMYTCHLGVYRREVARRAGGFDSRFDGCQDYDFVLRVAELTDRIAHIDEPLYHWRAHEDSTAGGEQAKPYAYVSQPQAIEAHLARRGVQAEVQFGAVHGMHRVVFDVDPTLDVTLVLAVADDRGLASAAASWVAQPHDAWRVLMAAPAAAHAQIRRTLLDAGVPAERLELIKTLENADPHESLRLAADAATTEQLILCQQPVLGLSHGWIARLLGYSAQPRIAAAGPILLTPGGRIRDAGVANPAGIPLPLLHGLSGRQGNAVAQNVAAVSGVLATRRSVHVDIGGLRPEYGPLALVDYCLRGQALSLRTVIVPDARLLATGPDESTNDLAALRRHHRTHPGPDPYYNASFRSDRGDYALSVVG